MWIILLVDSRSPWGWTVGEMDTTQPFLLKELKDAGSAEFFHCPSRAVCAKCPHEQEEQKHQCQVLNLLAAVERGSGVVQNEQPLGGKPLVLASVVPSTTCMSLGKLLLLPPDRCPTSWAFGEVNRADVCETLGSTVPSACSGTQVTEAQVRKVQSPRH